MTESTNHVISAKRRIQAPAADIFSVLISPQSHVDIDASGTLRAPVGSDPIAAVGDTFEIEMHHDSIGDYQMVNIVTVFAVNSALEWKPTKVGRSSIGYVYGYRLEPIDADTTDVTSYHDWRNVSQKWHDVNFFPRTSVERLDDTLANLQSIVGKTTRVVS
ncbi:polyketide cyclase [Jatrophihabitans sp. DSM 45814]